MTQAEKGEAENGKDKERDREREQRGVKRPIVPAAVPESLQEVRPGPAARGAMRGRAAAATPRGGASFPLAERLRWGGSGRGSAF